MKQRYFAFAARSENRDTIATGVTIILDGESHDPIKRTPDVYSAIIETHEDIIEASRICVDRAATYFRRLDDDAREIELVAKRAASDLYREPSTAGES
jgi:hypothetical protein